MLGGKFGQVPSLFLRFYAFLDCSNQEYEEVYIEEVGCIWTTTVANILRPIVYPTLGNRSRIRYGWRPAVEIHSHRHPSSVLAAKLPYAHDGISGYLGRDCHEDIRGFSSAIGRYSWPITVHQNASAMTEGRAAISASTRLHSNQRFNFDEFRWGIHENLAVDCT